MRLPLWKFLIFIKCFMEKQICCVITNACRLRFILHQDMETSYIKFALQIVVKSVLAK